MSLPDGTALGERLRSGDRSAAPEVLNLVENRAPAARPQIAALLRSVSPAVLGGEAKGHIVGVTGPPGAGKSSLLSELIAAWRGAGLSVAVLAVDPAYDAVFIRSTAAAGRLGGLAPATREAAAALAAAFDLVVVEPVGVG